MTRSTLFKAGRWLLFGVLFIAIACLFQHHLPIIIHQLAFWGHFAPFCFIFLYCLVSVLCLPNVPLVLAGGALFGPVIGTLLNLFGASMGAICGFNLTRHFGRNEHLYMKHHRMQKWMDQVDQYGWKSVALLRLTPAIPYNLVNYGLGLTRIKFTHYLFATIIFLIPNKLIMTYCGYYASQHLNVTVEKKMQLFIENALHYVSTVKNTTITSIEPSTNVIAHETTH